MPVEKLKFAFGIYEGETDEASGLRHGKGTLLYTNGNVYEGAWVQGAATGRGKKKWANGDAYEGGFLAGKKHGEGRYTFANGAVYAGEYEDDAPCGNGLQIMPNGDCYEGEWYGGRRHGEGVETLHDGQRFVGTWVNGKKNGRGELTVDGECIIAIWEADRCTEIISRRSDGDVEGSAPSSDVSNAARAATRSRSTDHPPPLPMEEMLAEMAAAGLDPELLAQISNFNTNVFGQMERVVNGLGSLDSHLNDLRECLDEVEGIKEDSGRGGSKE